MLNESDRELARLLVQELIQKSGVDKKLSRKQIRFGIPPGASLGLRNAIYDGLRLADIHMLSSQEYRRWQKLQGRVLVDDETDTFAEPAKPKPEPSAEEIHAARLGFAKDPVLLATARRCVWERADRATGELSRPLQTLKLYLMAKGITDAPLNSPDIRRIYASLKEEGTIEFDEENLFVSVLRWPEDRQFAR